MLETLVALVVLFGFTTGAARAGCPALFRSLPVSSAKDWESAGFTDPNRFRSGDGFRFIVHTVNRNAEGAFRKRLVGFAKDVDLLRNPFEISNFAVFSASLISREKPTVYSGEIALILKVPFENIIATRNVDMQTTGPVLRGFAQSPEKFRSVLERFRVYYGVKKPADLLARTPDGLYNELLIAGTSSTGSKTEVIGIAIFGDALETPATERATIENSAKANALPLISLPKSEADLSKYAPYSIENLETGFFAY